MSKAFQVAKDTFGGEITHKATKALLNKLSDRGLINLGRHGNEWQFPDDPESEPDEKAEPKKDWKPQEPKAGPPRGARNRRPNLGPDRRMMGSDRRPEREDRQEHDRRVRQHRLDDARRRQQQRGDDRAARDDHRRELRSRRNVEHGPGPGAAGYASEESVEDEKQDDLVNRRQAAWESHKRKRPHDVLDHFRYNDFLQIYEPRLERITRRKRNHWGAFTNVSELLHHPMHRQLTDRRLEELEKKEPLGEFRGTRIDLGSHIQLKLKPATVYCHIDKGVQEVALRLLAKRLKEHSLAGDTRITMKHGPRGKYKYYVWIKTSEMQSLTVEQIFEKLVKITKTRTRPVTLIISQSIVSGPIHNIWSTQYSLL